ncbi:hypothetical protein ACLOJK_040504 [Asimina triloba]
MGWAHRIFKFVICPAGSDEESNGGRLQMGFCCFGFERLDTCWRSLVRRLLQSDGMEMTMGCPSAADYHGSDGFLTAAMAADGCRPDGGAMEIGQPWTLQASSDAGMDAFGVAGENRFLAWMR